ncbi:LPS export ABC transporter periplasmic protein LptC [Wohlfahrtiimonas larvae]|uniref:LPS export ABC transporter periplasmic protein LptC n=1 Tax=Wohlfahrtiimonas larvae TaxID=1157986 RepID=A0ABP9MAZ2_9GAMM|nr:LPS export ABC transporter periplasmic protein LptC [Wohlfahrtiimonas larvae]
MFSKQLLQNLFFIVAIGILGYISMNLYRENNVEEVKKSPYPLFVVKGYDLVRFNENGQKIYSIEGPEMHHFDDDRGSTLSNPFLTHFTITDRRDWTARSDIALVNEDQSLITMNDNVVLTKFNQEDEKTTILNTSQLFVHDKGEKVTNDVWTKIRTYPNNTIEGISLEGYPQIGQFNLLQDVKSYYETIKDENHP